MSKMFRNKKYSYYDLPFSNNLISKMTRHFYSQDINIHY